MSRKIDLHGERFGRLLVVARADNLGIYTRWLCRCDCGADKVVKTGLLITGRTSSCGCLRSENAASLKRSHELWDTCEYGAWSSAKGRCYNKNNEAYERYGGRGIGMCAGCLEDFLWFRQCVGLRPSGKYSLDREDNARGYECGKCHECVSLGRTPNMRWATPLEQNINRRNSRCGTVNGQLVPAKQFAKMVGLRHTTVCDLMKHGWTMEEIYQHQPAAPQVLPS